MMAKQMKVAGWAWYSKNQKAITARAQGVSLALQIVFGISLHRRPLTLVLM